MEIKYSKIVARETKEAIVEIYGNIGEQVNGDYLAKEINYLGQNYDVITFKINSLGGSVMQGLSIVGAIVSSPAKTIAHIEGIAGSMAGVVALSCRKVKMNDYARLMLHAPRYLDDNGDVLTSLTADEVESIKNLTGQMTDILCRRGKSKTEVEGILKKDTWYKAAEALDGGFADEIVNTGVASAAARLSIEKLVAFANEKTKGDTEILLTNIDTMKKIAAKLGLPETADEQAIVAALDLKDTNLAAARTKLVDSAIAAGKKSGAVTDINEAQMRRLAVADLDLFVDMVMKPSEAGADNTRISEVLAKINENLSKEQGPKDEKNWDWYQKNAVAELKAMKHQDPAKYKKLYKEYWGTELVD